MVNWSASYFSEFVLLNLSKEIEYFGYFFTHKKWGNLFPFFIPPLCFILCALCSYLYSILSYLYSFSFFLNSYKKGRNASLFVFHLCSFCFVLFALIKKRPRPFFYIARSNLKLKLVPLSNFDSTWILLP